MSTENATYKIFFDAWYYFIYRFLSSGNFQIEKIDFLNFSNYDVINTKSSISLEIYVSEINFNLTYQLIFHSLSNALIYFQFELCSKIGVLGSLWRHFQGDPVLRFCPILNMAFLWPNTFQKNNKTFSCNLFKVTPCFDVDWLYYKLNVWKWL